MPAPLFELITELQNTIRRDFPLADENILNPMDGAALVEGEWLELDGSYRLKRGATASKSLNAFPVHSERGRYETQAIRKTTVLYAGAYEGETVVHGDLTGLNPGDALTVGDVNMGGVTRRGLKKAAAGDVVHASVTKITAAGNVQKLRFLKVSPFVLPA